MDLTYIPILQVQRELYQLPCGIDRFRSYLETMIDFQKDDIKLPLAEMNPMGKDHLLVFLDKLLKTDAESVARDAKVAAAEQLQAESGTYKVCLVVSDDLQGGWTNRYTSEFNYRFRQRAMHKRGWISVILWTSEEYTAAQVREEVLLSIFRAWYAQRNGYATTLGEILAQEEQVMARAGASRPTLDADDLEYTREVLTPYLAKTDPPTVLGALYGDEAARQLGYRPLGLSVRAGLALALANARQKLERNKTSQI